MPFQLGSLLPLPLWCHHHMLPLLFPAAVLCCAEHHRRVSIVQDPRMLKHLFQAESLRGGFDQQLQTGSMEAHISAHM
jgi:hypothetical protein